MNRTALLAIPAFCYALSAMAEKPYVVLDGDLTQLREDFNSASDKLRQVFISGPTCGICLRGMVDLHEAYLRDLQGDPRVHTYVVHVPTMGAEERHVAPTIPLMDGPRITHYWDGRGTSGLLYQETLGWPVYAWDVWILHRPGGQWTDLPPPADFWQHQIGGLDIGEKLDPEAFAAQVHHMLADIPVTAATPSQTSPPKSETGAIIGVGQPRGVMIAQHIEGRGGYENLKHIDSVTMRGTVEVDGTYHPLTVTISRPDTLKRAIGDAQFVVREGAVVSGAAAPGIDDAISEGLWSGFEMDGWFVEWKDKGHKVWRLGMQHVDGKLPWLMEVEHRDGQVWEVLLDSHSGDALRYERTSPASPKLVMEQDRFEEVDGVRFPHQIRYFANDTLLAVDRIDHIAITRK